MLLIGDLHITSKIKDKLIDQIRNFVDENPSDDTVIFLGDFVYHFSYDRNALLELYQLFLELFGKGKQIYVLAGNHDRLGETFVFHEAQKAFEVLHGFNLPHAGKLTFITEPLLTEIQGKKVYFLPSMITAPQLPKNISEKIADLAYLAESKSKNEQLSRAINATLADVIEKNSDLLVIHHYYINNTQFPGQKSKFSYRDLALSERFLDISTIKLISWHLHQAFSFKNYLCTGSVRYTSSLENNHEKYLFSYNPSEKKLSATAVAINPYVNITLNVGEQLTNTTIQNQLQSIQELSKKNFTSTIRIPNFQSTVFSLSTTSVSLVVDEIDYQDMNRYVDDQLFPQLRELRLKKRLTTSSEDLVEKLKVSSADMSSFADRKSLLKSYLQQKYPTEIQKYEKVLEELKIM